MPAKGLYRVRQINGYEYAVVEYRKWRKVPQLGEVSRDEYRRQKIQPPFELLPPSKDR